MFYVGEIFLTIGKLTDVLTVTINSYVVGLLKTIQSLQWKKNYCLMKNVSDFFLLIITSELGYLGSTMCSFKISKLSASELCTYRTGNVLGVEGFVERCLVWLCLVGLDTKITPWGSSGPPELIGKCKWKTECWQRATLYHPCSDLFLGSLSCHCLSPLLHVQW